MPKIVEQEDIKIVKNTILTSSGETTFFVSASGSQSSRSLEESKQKTWFSMESIHNQKNLSWEIKKIF